MKPLLILIMLLLSLQSHTQNAFTQNRWNSNSIVGVKDFKFSDAPVKLVLDTLNRQYPYGYITEFLPDSSFQSYSIGWCGNACNVISKGTYRITKSTIELFVMSVGYFGDCKDMPSEEVRASLGLYRWEKQGPRLILIPVSS